MESYHFEGGLLEDHERESILAQLQGTTEISQPTGWMQESAVCSHLGLDPNDVANIAFTLGFEPKQFGASLVRRRVAYTANQIEMINKEIRFQSMSDKVPIFTIATHTGSGHETIERIISDLGISPSDYQNRGGKRFPLYDKFVIRQIETLKDAKDNPEDLSLAQIARALNRHPQTVGYMLDELEIEPTAIGRAFGEEHCRYSVSVLEVLRKYDNEQNPPAGDWVNMLQLIKEFDHDREWLERRLDEAGIESEMRRNAVTGKTHEHYPYARSALAIRKAENRTPNEAEEGWMTEESIASELGRSGNWVRLRLGAEDIESKMYLDANRVPRKHYSPEIFDELKQESEKNENTPPNDDFMSTSQMAKKLEKSQLWIENRIAPFKDLAEPRKDKLGRVHECYPPEVFEAIEAELQELQAYPESEEFLTISALAKAIGRTDYWVKRRLARMGIEPETRRDGIGRLRDHYPPYIVKLLQDTD